MKKDFVGASLAPLEAARGEEDYEWDPKNSTSTAWSHSRTSKGKRAYGKKSSVRSGTHSGALAYGRQRSVSNRTQETVKNDTSAPAAPSSNESSTHFIHSTSHSNSGENQDPNLSSSVFPKSSGAISPVIKRNQRKHPGTRHTRTRGALANNKKRNVLNQMQQRSDCSKLYASAPTLGATNENPPVSEAWNPQRASWSESQFQVSNGSPPLIPPRDYRTNLVSNSLSISGNSQMKAQFQSTPQHSRGYSASSISSTDSAMSTSAFDLTGEMENMNPNGVKQAVSALKFSVSPVSQTSKRNSRCTSSTDKRTYGKKASNDDGQEEQPLEAPVRSQSPNFSSHDSGGSFSSLAKSGDIISGWMRKSLTECVEQWETPGNAHPPFAPDLATSPVRSISSTMGSSRKRGVCASPLIDADSFCDRSSPGSRSISQVSMQRSRSRSRIFSPAFTKKIIADDIMITDPIPDNNFTRKRTDSYASIDTTTSLEKSPYSFEQGDESDDEESFVCSKSFGNDTDDEILPPMMVRRSSSSILAESAFGFNAESSMKETNDNTLANAVMKTILSVDSIFASIPSYEDLKYMIKTLRKVQQSNVVASFGARNSCTIVPPNVWDSGRRAAFIQWATKKLGFSLRYGGGTVAFLQSTSSRATETLKALEGALIEHKSKQKGEQLLLAPRPTDNFGSKDTGNLLMTSKTPGDTKMMDTIHFRSKTSLSPMTTPMFATLTECAMSVVKTYTPRLSSGVSPAERNIEEMFLETFDSLKLTDARVANEGVKVTMNENKEPTLVRMVTLEANTEAENRVGEMLPGFLDSSPINGLAHQPRLSVENALDDRDLVNHLHGISPRDHTERTRMTHAAPSSFGKPRFSGDAFSPFPRDMVTFGQMSDFVETPMPKPNTENWGSRPIPGKDWGGSNRCDEYTIALLLHRFQTETTAADCFTGSPSEFEECSSSCLVHSSIAQTAANSEVLGFDFEVDAVPQLERVIDANLILHDDYRRHTVVGGHENKSETIVEFSGCTSTMRLSMGEMKDAAEIKTKKRLRSMAKHKRVSVCAAARDTRKSMRPSLLHGLSRLSLAVGEPTTRIGTIGDGINVCFPLSPLGETTRRLSVMKSSDDQSVLGLVTNIKILTPMLLFLNESELLCTASLVCSQWADAATEAHALLMRASVGGSNESDEDSVSEDTLAVPASDSLSIAKSMERSWTFLTSKFPWASFLSEGSFKRVYRVWNSSVHAEEAVSVMDVEKMDNKMMVETELSVAVMLSSLVRRNICPNFVVTRGVFTSQYEPPASHWGCAENKRPKGSVYLPGKQGRIPREPKNRGSYQYIRMELCRHGDIEEYIKSQENALIAPQEARLLLFQMAFALHTAGDKYALKHYDVKLLNFFLQSANEPSKDVSNHPHTILRYGVGSHVFNLRMETSKAMIAKLADYGTANIDPDSNGQPVTIGQFCTIENSPPDYMLLGDAATQGHGHDCFGLGLCMLHLFTGDAPYEEILESIRCPPTLKMKLQKIWQSPKSEGYEVIKSIVLDDVYDDDVEGEADDTLFDTLYRFLVLFGIPEEKFQIKEHGKVWRAIISSLESPLTDKFTGRTGRRKQTKKNRDGQDAAQYKRDCKQFSLSHGEDKRIANAKKNLEKMDGGLELLRSLVAFDPNNRATALDVINSSFMAPLIEEPGFCGSVEDSDLVHSFMAYATKK